MRYTAYDIGCALLALVVLCIPAVLIAAALICIIPPVSADTLIVYTTNETDGLTYRYNHNQTWANIRDGGGNAGGTTNVVTGPRIWSDLQIGTFYYIYRTPLIFDTSGLPDNAILSAASISLYRESTFVGLGDSGVSIVNFTIDGTISPDDYDNFGNDLCSAYQNISTLSGMKYYNWSLNALGISSISKTGSSGFGARLQHDIINVSPPWSSNAASIFSYHTAESVVKGPILEITYTVPDTTPPASITNLANTTTCNAINWSWDNPADADFGGVVLYKDNVFAQNTTTETGIEWTGLNPLTSYTLSTRTFDTNGNVNATWVNQTATTTSCGAPTPTPAAIPFQSDFAYAPTCGNVPFSVVFTDTSTGENITFWSWDFGDGNTSVLEDDINLYSSPGLYTVRHSIDDGLGNVSWDNKTGAVRAVPDWITCAAASGAGGGGGSTGGEAVGAAFGIVGGIIGAIVILRRRGEAP